MDEDDIFYANDSAIIHQSRGLKTRLRIRNLLRRDGIDFGKYKETKYKSETMKFQGKELKLVESKKFRDIKQLILHGNYLKKNLKRKAEK